MVRGVTAVYVDGNSVSCASMAGGEDGSLLVEGLCHHEEEEFFETARRLHHPVFMDVDCAVFNRKERLGEVIGGLLGARRGNYPVIGVLAPEKTFTREQTGPLPGQGSGERWRSLLREYLPANPFDFPAAFLLEEEHDPAVGARSRLLRFRMSDLLPFEQILRGVAPAYAGLVPAQRSLRRMATLLWEGAGHAPTTLCDVGKLRTIYATVPPAGGCEENCIPVGLARDDRHYFRSMTPTIEGVQRAAMATGKLILPSEAAQLSLHPGESSTPQGDATRMAIQVSRYAARSMENSLAACHGEGEGYPGAHYLTGRASRVPGLRQYMEGTIRTPLRRIDRRPIDGLTLAGGVTWADVADCLLPLGACLDALDSRPAPGALLNDVGEPLTFRGRLCTVADLQPGQLYLLEQGTQFT